jgi:hypothetical protein
MHRQDMFGARGLPQERAQDDISPGLVSDPGPPECEARLTV